MAIMMGGGDSGVMVETIERGRGGDGRSGMGGSDGCRIGSSIRSSRLQRFTMTVASSGVILCVVMRCCFRFL